MPEISVLPAVPTSPVAPGAVAPTVAAPRDGSSQGEAGFASFVSQLQAALGSLGLLPQATSTAGTGKTAEVATPELAAASDSESASPVDSVLPEVLAALGLVPVPTTLTPLMAEVLTDGAPVPTSGSASVASSAVPALPALSAQQQPAAVEPTVDARRADTQLSIEAPAQPQPLPATPVTAATAQKVDLPTQQLPSQDLPVDVEALPLQQLQQTTQQPLTQQHAMQQSESAQPGQAQRTQHATLSLDAPTGAPIAVPTTTAQQGTSQGDGSTRDGDAAPVGEALTDTVGETKDALAPQTFSLQATPTSQQSPADVKPSHVVGQIAHQADLYRLPGGRGVRIQLNPDDLGGVGVTIKYGASGGLELHLNVEHAATAELVQNGWHELRDALSLQGIAPERLIMSISSPSGSSFSDAGNGSFRSDAGQTGFGQAAQQQQPQERDSGRGSRGFTSLVDAPTASPDDLRSAAAAQSSRIDLRA